MNTSDNVPCSHALVYKGSCMGGDEYVCKNCGEEIEQHVDTCGG